MGGDQEELLRHFRTAFAANPANAYREWFRLQEELREREDAELSRALADDLWPFLPELSFPSEEEKAKFFHNIAVFFGSPGPAADLSRAREGFSVALTHFRVHEDSGWHARVLHNFATSLSNLGDTREDLSESVSLFDRALEWRTTEREIARGVTLHNQGIALRRLARLEPARDAECLERSAVCLEEASRIRERHGLAEGRALSLFHLGITRDALKRGHAAKESFLLAADLFDHLEKLESAAIARERAATSKED